MKFKDFLTKLKKDGKITQAEFDTAIESSPDFDFPDKAVEAFEQAFLTVDRAASHKDVKSRIKPEMLDPLDNDFKKILTIIDGIDKFKASEIDKLHGTYEKSAAITAYLPELINKLKVPSTDEDTKKELTKHKTTVQELLQKIEGMNTETANREKHWQKESEEKINSYRLRSQLEKLSNGLTFGKAYSDGTIRKDITKAKLNELIALNKFQLIEKNEGADPDIQVLDTNGQPRFINNGNTPLTINHLLEESFAPYIKANNTGDEQEDKNKGQQQETNRFKVSDDNKTQFRQGARTTVYQK